MKLYRVNRPLDVAERTAWTFLNAFLGLLTVEGLTSVDVSTVHMLEAAAISAAYTTLKALAAQHVGGSGLGDAAPGGSVLEEVNHK